MTGALVLVGTPIGNMGDLSPRAAEALREADAVACEDTRRAGRLFQLAGIERRPLVVLNEHTEEREAAGILRRLDSGERVAVITDAGMPGISDPGERLVRAVVGAGHRVEVVPGPSAAIAALVVSGLPAARFVFEGFLPRKGSARTERLSVIAGEQRTVVLYESPHRAARTLADLRHACGGARRVVVARELTKLYEELWRGSLDEAVAWAEGEPPRGEIVLVLDGGAPPAPAGGADLEEAIRRRLAAGDSVRDAAASVSAELRVPKRRAYEVAVSMDDRSS